MRYLKVYLPEDVFRHGGRVPAGKGQHLSTVVTRCSFTSIAFVLLVGCSSFEYLGTSQQPDHRAIAAANDKLGKEDVIVIMKHGETLRATATYLDSSGLSVVADRAEFIPLDSIQCIRFPSYDRGPSRGFWKGFYVGAATGLLVTLLDPDSRQWGPAWFVLGTCASGGVGGLIGMVSVSSAGYLIEYRIGRKPSVENPGHNSAAP